MRKTALAMILLLGASTAFGAWNPEGWEQNGVHEEPAGAVSAGGAVLNGLLSFYRSVISPVDTSKCPSYPTCSAYALKAIDKHGALKGAVLTASRLVSEADEAAFAPKVYVGGEVKVWYPVEETFFLESK